MVDEQKSGAPVIPVREYLILVVDDNPEDREMARRYLTRAAREAYRIVYADTGEAALAAFKAHRPDCVLLDFHLPDMTGLEFLAELIYETDEHILPIVMLTGTGSEDIAVEAMKRGVQDYLVKGRVTAEALERSVQYAIDRATMLRKLEEQRLELEQKNRDLQSANERKDEFLAMLAHELRNPLAPILNALHVQKVKRDDTATVDRVARVVERQVRHLARLTDDLLDVARITRGKILLRRERLDLTRLVRETVEDLRAVAEQGRLRLTCELPNGPVWIDGDRTRLAQVLTNLAGNAIKFTDAGGQVTVRLTPRTNGRQAVISITDTGIGMEPDVLARVFETFSQADETLDRSRGGLGLGLALAKGLVELHGGELRAQSAGLGQGSTFTMVLPVESGQGQPAEAMPPEIPAPTARSRRVLVVEDNPDSADTLAELMDLWGHQVWVAHNGPAAIQTAIAHLPEVVLLDIGLPGMDGYEVARRLREEASLGQAYVVALTGYGQDEDRQRSRAAGFHDHLTKPADPERLKAILATAPTPEAFK